MNRTNDEINKVLALAKINKDDLLPTSQTIHFSENHMSSGDYKLIQLNSHLLTRLKGGESLFINGEPHDTSVLCTEDTTYEVLGAETSNSLLLVHNLQFSDSLKDKTERDVSNVIIQGIYYDYFEVNQSKPQLQKVDRLLEKAVYKGEEHEYKIKQEDLLTFDELWRKVQCSKMELKAALNEKQVVTINGSMRILDFEYHFRVLSYMLKLIEENSWGLDEIDYEETMNALDDLIPNEVLNCLFDLYTEESKVVDSSQLYRYKERDVCKFFAQVLLHSAGKFNLNEFLQAWQESVPEGMTTAEEMLHGIAVVDRKSNPNVIWTFPENRLPENLTERFKVLFGVKEKWSVPEISPYLQRLTSDKLDVNAVLAKYARASSIDGVKYYCSKHAK